MSSRNSVTNPTGGRLKKIDKGGVEYKESYTGRVIQYNRDGKKMSKTDVKLIYERLQEKNPDAFIMIRAEGKNNRFITLKGFQDEFEDLSDRLDNYFGGRVKNSEKFDTFYGLEFHIRQ